MEWEYYSVYHWLTAMILADFLWSLVKIHNRRSSFKEWCETVEFLENLAKKRDLFVTEIVLCTNIAPSSHT